MPTKPDSIDLGHEDEIMEAFVAYDRLVRWEEHNSRLDATEPIVERAYARGRIVALVANLAAQALGVTSDDSETTTPNTEPNPDSIVEAHVVRAGQFASVWRYKWPGDERWREHEVPNPIVESLVAENARLREAMGRLDVRASDLTKAVRECADDRYIQRNLPILHGYLVGLLAEYPPTVAEQRALKGDD